jgi:hypothetical protein
MIFSMLHAQELPTDREKFVKEFDKLLRQSTSENLKPFISEKLGPLLLQGSDFPQDYYAKMVVTANKMLEKRMKPYPEVYNYVYSVYTLAKDKQPKESYVAWHNALDKMLDGKNVKRFKDFVEISGAFFERNAIALNPNFEWLYIGGTYKFEYEKDPMILLEGGKLVARTFNRGRDKKENPFTDSIVIQNTSGVYDLLKEKWEGSGGRLTWEKVGLPGNTTYAELNTYQLSMKSTSLSCDTVTMYTPYISGPVKGKLSDRAQRGSINENIELPYPQFLSFQKKFEINNLIPEVNYVGGFSMQGGDFVGVGTNEEPATLEFLRNGKTFVRTYSRLVSVSDTKLSAQFSRAAVYIGLHDSITHPGLNVNFLKKENSLILSRGLTGLSQAPFVNYHHQLDMYVEQIIWNRSGGVLDLSYNFATPEQQRQARFESFDYYDPQLYEQQQAMETVNPLTALWKYAYKYDEYIMPEGKAATAIGRTIQQAKSKLLELAALGFISYDTENGIVTITEKLERFVKAREGKKDYDNISFASNLIPIRMDGVTPEEIRLNKELREYKERVDKSNQERSKFTSFGEIDLGTLELRLKAVDDVPISIAKNTIIFPENNEITVKGNRTFNFKGWINSGKWEVHVLEGVYTYEKNKFNIFESDMAFFRSNPISAEHGKKPIPINSRISGIKGELLVDDIKNRSGMNDKFEYFPVLDSKEKTRVYYNYKSIHIGAYDSTRFYFELDPFKLDSLRSFDEQKIRFDGELVSAGIFPKFREQLKMMPDYSLGFSHQSPSGGYPFYGDEATYDNKIILSNNGLQGGGSIAFIHSISESKHSLFTFLPDSAIGIVRFVNNPWEEGVEFPDVVGENAAITYLPRQKIMKVRSNEEPLNFFDGEAALKGTSIIRENGMRGNGFMDFKDAQLFSTNYAYTRWKIDADTANFNLANTYREPGDLTEDELAFKTENVTANVDFRERRGDFKSNAGESTVNFPVNKYICKIDMFTWFMDTDEIELEKADDDLTIDSDMDFVGPNFFSTHPKQDSLQFRAPIAKFSLKEKTIYCSKTEYIQVADARVYPDNMKVTIRKNAKLDPLDNSEIVASYITKYHRILRANTEIKARNAYTARGEYPYYDRDSNLYVIQFPKIGLDTSFQTIAVGTIKSDDGFQLSDEFDYYGKVNLFAAKPFLEFQGATRINHDCDKFERNWMAFTNYIDPQNIQIPVAENMKDLDGNPISAGILWRHSQDLQEVKLYPTFLSQVLDKDDPVVITASGWLQYQPDSKEYQIASREKLINRGEKGNYISLHTESCSMNGDGLINLGMDYGNMEVDAIGVINYNQANQETSMNLTLRIKTPMDQKLFESVGKKLGSMEELRPVDFSSTTLEQAIMEWTDREKADKIKSDWTLKQEFKRVPKEMQETMLITGLRLVSYANDDDIGLKSSTDYVGVVNMYGESVMKYVPMKFFAQQRTLMGDRMGLMIDIPGGSFYFFDYDYRKDGKMNILTSDSNLNDGINTMKPDKRKEKKFSYQTTQDSAYKSQFLRIFQD